VTGRERPSLNVMVQAPDCVPSFVRVQSMPGGSLTTWPDQGRAPFASDALSESWAAA
jgi:hypothetical protein